MSTETNWESELRQEIERLSNVFITGKQFRSIIQTLLKSPDCPVAGLQFEILCPEPFASKTLGNPGQGPPDARTIPVNDDRDTKCRIYTWAKPGVASNPTELEECWESLFGSYWKPQLRTKSAGMFDLKLKGEVRNLARRTVERCRRREEHSALLFADLDNFGQVNKLITYAEGNRVIKEFGAVLESVCSEAAILLHYGGDEFIALIPGGSGEEIVLLAYEIWQGVGAHDFKTPGVELGVSCGLATTEEDEEKRTFDELEQAANKALNGYAKKPRKGRARFVERSSPSVGCDLATRLNVGFCLVRSTLLSRVPLANVWLNCVSQVITKSLSSTGVSAADIKRNAEEFLAWADLDPLTNSEIICCNGRAEGFDANPRASGVDLAFALAHGLLSQTLVSRLNGEGIPPRLVLRYDPGSNSCALILGGKDTLWASGPTAALSCEFEVGTFWKLASDNAQLPGTSARAVLIQVGHEDIGLPAALFVERIVVDDRPTRGGGLPDFWEATIARLIVRVLEDPNIAIVYLVGRDEYAARTVAKLKDVHTWKDDEETISYRIGMSTQVVRTGSKALEGKVLFPDNRDELVAHLAETLRAPHTIQPLSHLQDSRRIHRFLRREMQVNVFSLARNDGCRVRTIAEAYPVVLEIIRLAEEEKPIRDQAGQQLRELIDFKVHLTCPTQDLVPQFYAGEKNSLEEYFEKQFRGAEGLFWPPFTKSKQLEGVLEHLSRAVSHPRQQFATRRAILVIPHEIKETGDLAPLGLVSVRCAPRFLGSRIVIHFSYTWRTVEALVGLPYSLYGSVRFSQFLLDEVKKRVSSDLARQVEMGEVSYIAHSLHMFVDEYGQNIAKRIVDDASI